MAPKYAAGSAHAYFVSQGSADGGNMAYYDGSAYQPLIKATYNTWSNWSWTHDGGNNNAGFYGVNGSTWNKTSTMTASSNTNNITFGLSGAGGPYIAGVDNLAAWNGRIMNSTHKANVVIGAEFPSSDTTPPSITVQSPANTSYTTNSIWFNITLSEAGSWAGYSRDGASNITMANSSGNWNAQNISMSQGSHNIRFYANDTSGNMNASSIIYFTIDTISPSLLSFTPSAGTVGIDTNTTINLTFSENMDQSTFSGVTMKDSNNVNVPLTLQSFSNATYTAIFKPSSLLGSNKAYTATLTGLKDLAGNLLPNKSWSFTTATSYSINLSKSGANGWNLISLPVVPANTNIASVLSNVINDIENVWTYNSIAGNWSMYAPNSPNSSDLSTMTAGYGYWINYNGSVSKAINGSGNLIIEGASTPPQRTLISGWNLIGYYQRENTTSIALKCALFTLTPNINDETAKWWSMVFGYDNQNKQLTQVGYTGNMSPGQGYWAFMTSKLSTYLYGPGLSAGECA